MSQEDESGEVQTLDALDQLRAECQKLSAFFIDSWGRIERLNTQIANPNAHGIPADLPFKIEMWDDIGNRIRWTVSANTNVTVAHGAFDAAARSYPQYRWTLRHGALVIREHKPG